MSAFFHFFLLFGSFVIVGVYWADSLGTLSVLRVEVGTGARLFGLEALVVAEMWVVHSSAGEGGMSEMNPLKMMLSEKASAISEEWQVE